LPIGVSPVVVTLSVELPPAVVTEVGSNVAVNPTSPCDGRFSVNTHPTSEWKVAANLELLNSQ